MTYLWLGLLGLAVGGFGTIIGAGGGFLLMPILAALYPTEPPAFLASMSLAVVFFNAASGSVGYARMKRIDYRAGLIFSAATVPGAIVGAIATGYLPRKTFDLLLAAAIIAGAIFILFSSSKRRGQSGQAHDEHAPRKYNMPLGIAISLVVGFISSLLGIGGGIVHVPALVFLLHFPVHIATATSHFVLAITAATGTGVHLWEGSFAGHGLRRTLALAIGVVIGAQIGARISTKTPHTLIMRSLAVALIAVGIRIVWQNW